MVFMLRIMGFTIVVLILLFCFSGDVLAIGLRPLVIEMDLEPGAVKDFAILLSPEETKTLINASLYQPLQQLDGGLVFEEGDPLRNPAINWVELDENKLLLIPGEELKVTGRVRVPFDARGSHMVTIMVEPEIQQDAEIAIHFRFAVRLRIKVERPGLRPTAEVEEFTLTAGEEKEPVLQALVRNTSALDYPTAAEATVRDGQGRLVERVELRPEKLWDHAQQDILMYPFSKLLYIGTVRKYLPPGEYQLRLFFRYAAGKQLIVTKTVEIGAEDFSFPETQKTALQVSLDELSFAGRPGTVSSRALTIKNTSGEACVLCLTPVNLEYGYAYSIFEHTEFTIRGDNQFLLEPGKKKTVITTVHFPRDAQIQGNYGFLRVDAFKLDGELLYEQMIPLEAVVAGDHQYTAEMLNFTSERLGEEVLFSLVLKNTGNIKIFPSGRVVVKDPEGRTVTIVELSGAGEEKTPVLPGKLSTLQGTSLRIPPGDYQMEVSIQAEKKELAALTMAGPL
ncbi:MAG: hypothetical protein GX085_07395 [Firmicutes bacterium]|nr:hypothetical protein [Bacillota bacterium]